MNPDRHGRIKDLFLEACAQPPDAREAFLSRACAGDDVLRREVERLLAHHVAAPSSTVSDRRVERPNRSARISDLCELPTYQTGDVVAGRYRIVALLGEGAMGRVYRALDDRLEQTVALKFLPRIQVLDPTWRRRVESEVKLSRDVGHSNICRVYDLGDVDGAPFISMEYVDGEDLASLLRRIGRLTGSRAIEIARQICVGLAAAHIHGVLHRDLKPANVMIDQKGRVRITDFGLAVMSGQVERGQIRAGTPRYMAPEQLGGIAVTEKSDIYSLGLVLYEMFTGAPAFDAENALDYLQLQQRATPRLPSEIVPEMDPTVEAVILACLKKDPAERPDSALNVAAALPGGDLLAAALDAGKIPTREMLATTSAQGIISRREIRRIAVVTLFLFVGAILLGNDTHPIAVHGGSKSPEVLFEKTSEVSKHAGFEPAAPYAEGRFFPSVDAEIAQFIPALAGKKMSLAIPGGDEVLFLCRESHSTARPLGRDVLSIIMPAMTPFQLESETVAPTTMILDGRGRLLFFESTSPSRDHGNVGDWQALVKASGFEPGELTPTRPLVIPGIDSEEQMAFQTPPIGSEGRSLRFEVAMRDHRVRFYAVLRESTAPTESVLFVTPARWAFIQAVRNGVLLVLLGVAIPGAWKNYKARGDLVGALRVGAFVFGLRMIGSILSIRHLNGFADAIEELAGNAVGALSEGMIVSLFYMALESHVRRLWPRSLGGWSRMLDGRIRDPFVGRDVLVGCAVGGFWAILVFLDRFLPDWMGWESRPQLRIYQSLEDLIGGRFAVAGVLDTLRFGIYQGLALLLVLTTTNWLTGSRRRIGLFIAWLIGAVMYAPTASHPVTAWLLFAPGIVALGLYLMMHWGLVSLVTAILVAGLLCVFPITFDFHAWYAGYGIFGIAVTLGVIGWSLRESLQPPTADPHPLLGA